MPRMTGSDPLTGDVEDVLITVELATRPSRSPDYEAESRALGILAQEMSTNPRGVLQKCAELVMELCHADSAGISILEPDGTRDMLRWHAAAGGFAPNLHGVIPREASPCGTVIERNAVLLFNEAERFFPALRSVEPRIYENLLAPWHVRGEAVGTLWAIKHTAEGRFDAEDARALQSLARFAAAAFQMTSALDEATAERLALRESEERYRAILESALDYAIFSIDPEGKIITWSPGAAAVFGWSAEEAIGQDIAMTFTPEDREQGAPAQERAEARERGVAPNIRWHLQRDGGRVFIEGMTRRMSDAQGKFTGFLKVGQDVTARREWEERQKVLVGELQHRTRNLMSVIRSTADKTASTSHDLADFRTRFRVRLDAMARVQGLLSRVKDADGVLFEELIEAEVSAMHGGAERIRLDGPKGIRLRSSTAQTLAMALHELATNALKDGAIGQPQGRLAVTWSFEQSGPGGEPWLHIDWLESEVAMPTPGAAPQGSGQGRELIERALPYQLQARTTYELGPDGVHCTISIPAPESSGASEASNG